MFNQQVITTNNIDRTRTNHMVAGHWWLSGEQQQEHAH
jgi:hypothetical protein